MDKLNVAIADDNDLMRQLLDTIVQSDEELSVVGTAKDGEEAYQMIKEKEPDVVLLDIVMPKMDGLGVLDKVQRDASIKKTPNFIMVSAVNQPQVTEDAFALGADYFIMKPFDQKDKKNPCLCRARFLSEKDEGAYRGCLRGRCDKYHS